MLGVPSSRVVVFGTALLFATSWLTNGQANDAIYNPMGQTYFNKNDVILSSGSTGPLTFAPEVRWVHTDPASGISSVEALVNPATVDYGAWFGNPNTFYYWLASFQPNPFWTPSGTTITQMPGMPPMPAPAYTYRVELEAGGRPVVIQGSFHVTNVAP